MRHLPIRDDILNETTRADMAIIASLMLWPNDAPARYRYVSSFVGALDYELPLPGPDWPGALAAYQDGMIAGGLLVEMVALFEAAPQSVNMTAHKRRIANAYTRDTDAKTRDRQMGKRIDNVVLPLFRPVAHLWAAHTYCRTQDVPCPRAQLPEFLAMADAFRKQGEVARAPRGRPFFKDGEALRIPAAIPLIAGKLNHSVLNSLLNDTSR
jgi:hypothetical protein